jgi:hypothetical protein
MLRVNVCVCVVMVMVMVIYVSCLLIRICSSKQIKPIPTSMPLYAFSWSRIYTRTHTHTHTHTDGLIVALFPASSFTRGCVCTVFVSLVCSNLRGHNLLGEEGMWWRGYGDAQNLELAVRLFLLEKIQGLVLKRSSTSKDKVKVTTA